jgi:hypothetical protein
LVQTHPSHLINIGSPPYLVVTHDARLEEQPDGMFRAEPRFDGKSLQSTT